MHFPLTAKSPSERSALWRADPGWLTDGPPRSVSCATAEAAFSDDAFQISRSGLSCHNVTGVSLHVFTMSRVSLHVFSVVTDSTMTMHLFIYFYVIMFIYSRLDHKHCASLGSCFCFSVMSQCKSTAGISCRPTECGPRLWRYFVLLKGR